MKKIILATAALALVFVSCNHEPEFDGMKEYSPGNVLKLELTYAVITHRQADFLMVKTIPMILRLLLR